MAVTVMANRKKQKLLFQQGPMTEREATEVCQRYRKRGNEVVTAESFDGVGVVVFVYSGAVKHG